VRDEQEISTGRAASGNLTQRAQLFRLARAIGEEVAEWRPDLRGTEGEPRSLETSTPRAREHAADWNAPREERGSYATRIRPRATNR
jgi:hypothetical protein